jgi:carboxymethylenebutenolidase
VVGFGWGGRIAWLYAAHDPAPRASVAWYGHFTRPATPQEPRHPLDVVSELKAPVLGLYGDADGGIPVGEVDNMRAALEAAGKNAQIVVYPDAHHAFNADDRPRNYQPEAAQAAWQRMLGWLNEHGVTSQASPAVAGTANATGASPARMRAHIDW